MNPSGREPKNMHKTTVLKVWVHVTTATDMVPENMTTTSHQWCSPVLDPNKIIVNLKDITFEISLPGTAMFVNKHFNEKLNGKFFKFTIIVFGSSTGEHCWRDFLITFTSTIWLPVTKTLRTAICYVSFGPASRIYPKLIQTWIL